MLDLREKLDEGILVGDGAIGTLLADRGVAQPYNEANLTHPQIVQALHGEYLHASAGIIEKNTFAANRLELAAHGLDVASGGGHGRSG